MASSISVNIAKNGKIKIQGIKGVFGAGCEKLTDALEKQGTLIKKTKTEDYYKEGDPKVNINADVTR